MAGGPGRSYPEGTIIYVDPGRTPMSGERVLARIDISREFTFKTFRAEDGRRWLQPSNPQYPAIFEPFQVVGTVVGSFIPEQ